MIHECKTCWYLKNGKNHKGAKSKANELDTPPEFDANFCQSHHTVRVIRVGDPELNVFSAPYNKDVPGERPHEVLAKLLLTIPPLTDDERQSSRKAQQNLLADAEEETNAPGGGGGLFYLRGCPDTPPSPSRGAKHPPPPPSASVSEDGDSVGASSSHRDRGSSVSSRISGADDEA